MGRTLKIDASKFKIMEDWKDKRGLITKEKLHEKQEELSPANTAILDYWAMQDFKRENNIPLMTSNGPKLSDMINLLTALRDKHGDVPLLMYDQETKCYYHCPMHDITVVSRYHIPHHNEKHQIMHIKNEKAVVMQI